jgi:hypothetical protein
VKHTLYLENPGDAQAAALLRALMALWHHAEVNGSGAKEEAGIVISRDPSLPDEGFRLVCAQGKAVLSGSGRRGVVNGLSALLPRYCRSSGGFTDCDIEDSPCLPVRGAHFYLPAKESVEGFKRIIDFLAYLRFNTLIIEVGGGMEYKNHPEINENWERFCEKVNNFPGTNTEFINTDPVIQKNSTHTELGGGSFLPQETVRGLVEYAKGYGMDVIPELQFISHSYYILASYPEFAERKNNYVPDVMCPKNEDAYELYFELAEEVLDVFKPNRVSIGQDEIWAFGICDECKRYSGHELLAYVLNRMHAFYKSKGVKIAMWGDKLQNLESNLLATQIGGGPRSGTSPLGRDWMIPATYEAIKLVPNDILLLDWMHLHSWTNQDANVEHGFQAIYGNFAAEQVLDWKRRLTPSSIIGAETSTWCLSDEYTLGRDGKFANMWYTGMMLWDREFDEGRHAEHVKAMRSELPALRELLLGRRTAAASLEDAELLYAAKPGERYAMPSSSLPERGVFRGMKPSLPEVMSGVPLGEQDIFADVGGNVKSLVFVHTCLGTAEFVVSYRLGVVNWCPAVYSIHYADGTSVLAGARFGIDVGCVAMDYGRRLQTETIPAHAESPDIGNPYISPIEEPSMYALNSPWRGSLMYSASPFAFGDDSWAYVSEWVNPRPDVAVERVYAINNVRKKEEQVLLYCIAAIR